MSKTSLVEEIGLTIKSKPVSKGFWFPRANSACNWAKTGWVRGFIRPDLNFIKKSGVNRSTP